MNNLIRRRIYGPLWRTTWPLNRWIRLRVMECLIFRNELRIARLKTRYLIAQCEEERLNLGHRSVIGNERVDLIDEDGKGHKGKTLKAETSAI